MLVKCLEELKCIDELTSRCRRRLCSCSTVLPRRAIAVASSMRLSGNKLGAPPNLAFVRLSRKAICARTKPTDSYRRSGFSSMKKHGKRRKRSKAVSETRQRLRRSLRSDGGKRDQENAAGDDHPE